MEREDETESGTVAGLTQEKTPEPKLSQNNGYTWFTAEGISVKGYVIDSGQTVLRGKELVRYFSAIDSFRSFKEKLTTTNGLYSVIVQRGNHTWAAVDIVRTFPLFYCQEGNQVLLSDTAAALRQEKKASFDNESLVLFRSSGYVPGRKTLLKDIFQIQAGECVRIDPKGQLESCFYYKHYTDILPEKDYQTWKNELKELLTRVGERLIKTLAGRPVALPLSGGYDSRLIAYWLKKHDYRQVFCFTYGLPNSKEVAISEKVAKQLGYDWLFVDYEKYYHKPFLQSTHFTEYVAYTSNYTTIPFLQEYFAAKHLLQSGKLKEDTVFIPGHAGDFVAGSHLRELMNKKAFHPSAYFIDQHFNWIYPLKDKRSILKTFAQTLDPPTGEEQPYLQYENWIMKERQAKLICNSSRLWDFCGYEYTFPLWDLELASFFRSLPFEHKLYKRLYNEVLSELFLEFAIFYPSNELHVSPLFTQWIECRKKIKKVFPILKHYIDIWKNDSLGFKTLTQEIQDELQMQKKDIIQSGGLFSSWYLQHIGADSTLPFS